MAEKKTEAKKGASTPAKKAAPLAGAVDVHKMVNESSPQIDLTKGEPKGAKPPMTAEEKEKEEAKQNADVEKSFKDVSDDVLAKCVMNEHYQKPAKDAKSDKAATKAGLKGNLTARGAFGAVEIPWATIWALLKSLGLPAVRPALVKLRDRILGTAWPSWIKNPLVAAINSILSDERLLAEFEARSKG